MFLCQNTHIVFLEQVFAVVAQGLSWMQGDDSEVTIAKSSISEMRGKIGYAPLQSLVACACRPLADAKLHPDAFYAGLPLVRDALTREGFEDWRSYAKNSVRIGDGVVIGKGVTCCQQS